MNQITANRKLVLNLIPQELGQPHSGFHQTITKIFHFIRHDNNIHNDIFWHHFPNHQYHNPLTNDRQLLDDSHRIALCIENQLSAEHIVLNIGGDHSAGIGTGWGFLRFLHRAYPPNTPKKLIWFDAHADLNTRASSLSGNMHGMPVAFLCGDEYDSAYAPEPLLFEPQEIIYIGVRDCDPYEIQRIEKTGMRVFPQIRGYEENILRAIGNHQHTHISFDVDCLDKSEMKNTGTIAFGEGLNAQDCFGLIRRIQSLPNWIHSFDIMEYNEGVLDDPASWDTMKYVIQETLAVCSKANSIAFK